LAKMHFFAGKATSWSSIFIIFQQANTTSQIVRNCGSKFRYSIHHQQKKTSFSGYHLHPLFRPVPLALGSSQRIDCRYCTMFLRFSWLISLCLWLMFTTV
jgi:hypothetical protein